MSVPTEIRDPKLCTHEEEVDGHWGPTYRVENWMTGEWELESDWIPGHSKSLMRDIDLHRMKCSRCGEIGYYSGAARRFYEEGITSNIKGLDGATS